MAKLVRQIGFLFILSGAVVLTLNVPRVSAQVPTASIQTGPRLDFPAGLATDNTTVWVANSRNNTVDAIDVTSRSISLIAGKLFQEGSNDGIGDSARFNGPDGVVYVGGNLYVLDTNNSDLRMINLGTRTVTTVAGTANISGTEDGHGNSAHFNLPTQIATDGQNLYICDTGNETIRSMSISDQTVKTIGGQPQQTGKQDGPATKSLFNEPRGIATDGKVVYISDTGNDEIRKIDLSSLDTTTIAGTGDDGMKDGPGKEAQFQNPGALCLSGTTLYVMDADNHAVRKIDTTTDVVSTLTQVNGHIGSGCTVTSDGKVLYYSDTTENAIQRTDTSNGNFVSLYPPGQ